MRHRTKAVSRKQKLDPLSPILPFPIHETPARLGMENGSDVHLMPTGGKIGHVR